MVDIMTNPNFEIIKKLTEMQHTEATLHWTRNGFFLLSSSILLVALGQFQTPYLMLSFGILGLMMNIVWLFIQYRSSEYIKHWKNKVKDLEGDPKSSADIYSQKVGGYEMRKLAFLLPFPFILIWAVVFGQAIIQVFE